MKILLKESPCKQSEDIVMNLSWNEIIINMILKVYEPRNVFHGVMSLTIRARLIWAYLEIKLAKNKSLFCNKAARRLVVKLKPATKVCGIDIHLLTLRFKLKRPPSHLSRFENVKRPFESFLAPFPYIALSSEFRLHRCRCYDFPMLILCFASPARCPKT